MLPGLISPKQGSFLKPNEDVLGSTTTVGRFITSGTQAGEGIEQSGLDLNGLQIGTTYLFQVLVMAMALTYGLMNDKINRTRKVQYAWVQFFFFFFFFFRCPGLGLCISSTVASFRRS